MATLEYRFTKSAPVLRDLSQGRHLSPLPPLPRSEPTEKEPAFAFIDDSLRLLADLQKAQDNHLRREFEQQRDFITGKFERERYDAGRSDQKIHKRFTDIEGQLDGLKKRFDIVETELDNFKKSRLSWITLGKKSRLSWINSRKKSRLTLGSTPIELISASTRCVP
jgi:hypothetical protein